ncbi:transposase [Rugamonas sp. DEMB1]
MRTYQRGHLPIYNNCAESAMRPFVLGREAWLFSVAVATVSASFVRYL